MVSKEILENCYYCRNNVAVGAKEAGVSLNEMKRLLRDYILARKPLSDFSQ